MTKAAIVTVGAELLLGLVADRNAHFVARTLTAQGIHVVAKFTVDDVAADIEEALRRACDHAGLVIITGGLGSTFDDVTRQAVAHYVGQELVLHPPALQEIERRFVHRGYAMPERNRVQAMIPQQATIFANPLGMALGFAVWKENHCLVSLPGVPTEMEAMLLQEVLPFLAKAGMRQGHRLTRCLYVCGLPESIVDQDLAKMTADRQRNPVVGLLCHPGVITIELTAHGETAQEVQSLLDGDERIIAERLGERLVGQKPLVETVVAALAVKNYTLAIAESCTGGLVTHLVSQIPGVSQYLISGMITYANAAKIHCLGVRAQTIDTVGAVSAETAAEMASGVAQKSGTQVGLSITGIAGPAGGTPEKPVGLVYTACWIEGRASVTRHLFSGERTYIQTQSAMAALNHLRLQLRIKN